LRALDAVGPWCKCRVTKLLRIMRRWSSKRPGQKLSVLTSRRLAITLSRLEPEKGQCSGRAPVPANPLCDLGMPHARSMTPRWDPGNLTRHRIKHAQCFAVIHNAPLTTITDGKFEVLSNDCFDSPMLSYAGEYRDFQTREYVESRHYFVDSRLAVAATTSDEKYFVTFYHEHFDRRCGTRPPPSATEGQRKLEYEQAIERDIDSGKLRSFKRLR